MSVQVWSLPNLVLETTTMDRVALFLDIVFTYLGHGQDSIEL